MATPIIQKLPGEILTAARADKIVDVVAPMLAKIQIVRRAMEEGQLRPHMGQEARLLSYHPPARKFRLFGDVAGKQDFSHFGLYAADLSLDNTDTIDPSGFFMRWSHRQTQGVQRIMTINAMKEVPVFGISPRISEIYKYREVFPSELQGVTANSQGINEFITDDILPSLESGVEIAYDFAQRHLAK
jgi:hypothetical protein